LSLLTNELTAVTNQLLAMYLNFHENGISLAQSSWEHQNQLAIHRNT